MALKHKGVLGILGTDIAVKVRSVSVFFCFLEKIWTYMFRTVWLSMQSNFEGPGQRFDLQAMGLYRDDC